MKHLGGQRLARAAMVLALAGSVVGAGASSAAASSDPLGGLLGGLLGGPTATSSPQATTISGHLDMADQRLRKGCRKYAYRYRLQIPDGQEFDFEILVTDPRGISQASDVILSGADPLSGTKTVTICRSNTEPGRFVLHGALYTNDGQGPTTTTTVPDDPFRLTIHKHKHKKRHHRA
ncbi:hypothetical protein [Nocardioides nematodiphilus]|uniref:hypothetical protein n=1 Tax=Nocardioides nematodiphilus TaxID=2849669 RepID=UPI001CDA1F14|nr:hypothetical protein [Nocardioides nematodiphilus]MCA1982438.1 hypothetical protein [Nocardioides nematodiphilus]